MPRQSTRRRFLKTTGSAALGAATTQGANGSLVVDVHAHLKHGDAAKTEYSAQDIVSVMDAVGIDRSIVFAMSTTTRHSIELAEAAVAPYPKRLIPFLYALPNYERPVLAEIKDALRNRGFRGIKIHAGEARLHPYIVDPVLKLAGERGVPCLIDAAGSVSTARRLAGSFPRTTILFAHMGAYMSRDRRMIDGFIQVAQEFDNAYLDLSAVALVFKMEEAVKKIGAEKMIWGTDGPHKNPNVNAYPNSRWRRSSDSTSLRLTRTRSSGVTSRRCWTCRESGHTHSRLTASRTQHGVTRSSRLMNHETATSERQS